MVVAIPRVATSATEATGTGARARPQRISPAHARGRSSFDRPAAAPASFRPELQGLRALAVGLVVVYHVWLGRVSGGVDVFFVLTGFLLTGQLYRAVAGNKLRLTQRFTRTFVRLTPAAFTVLIGTMIGAAIVLPEARWPQTVREVIASALFMENWQLASDSVDYAARSNAVSVVQHFWSLSIQGQFSVVWPVAVAIVGIVCRRTAGSLHRRLTATLVGLFTMSLTYSIVLTATNQPLAYFNSFTRVWEFALGGLLALWIDRIDLSMALRVAAGWIGVVGLISCGIVLEVDRLFPGFVALWPTTCAVLVLLGGHTKLPFAVDRVLASPAAQYLGDRSYALYLWHWPLLVLASGGGGLDGVGFRKGVVIIACSFVLAALTFRFVEKPMLGRRNDRNAARWCALGLVVVIGSAGLWQLAAVKLFEPEGTIGDTTHPGAAALGHDPVPVADLLPPPVAVYTDFTRTDRWNCAPLAGFDSTTCVQPFDGTPAKRIVVVGDSHAQQLISVLMPLAAKYHWQLTSILRGACPFSTASDTDPSNTTCVPWNAAALDYIKQTHPDAVVTVGTHNVRAGLTEATPPGFVKQWKNVTDLGIPLVAFRDNPRFPSSMPDCVATHPRGSTDCGVARSSVYSPEPPWTHAADVPPSVRFVDIADAVCDQVRCPAEAGNVLVYLDDNHVSAAYATTMAGPLEDRIRAAFGW